ncbi:LOW QUALITY PROTEIN: hypothetical protein GQ55_8G014200 [Panicum hallii var. hallii]|uniref:Uncharacterized protein n=1 Tax=Panicum hallii var. hallii TaxID=1504633 RepID=A0A2T7CJJ5_9POAL|nr:LOW QUALITY PROTEIN: hypothetical protein GQ55_8G014200 [Panicum hallii var. hallii]
MALMRNNRPKPAGAPEKKMKQVVKSVVPQRLIDFMILYPHKSLDGFHEEELGKRSQKFRDFYAEEKAISDKEYQQALVKQFRTKGYADDYTEVTDDEEDN